MLQTTEQWSLLIFHFIPFTLCSFNGTVLSNRNTHSHTPTHRTLGSIYYSNNQTNTLTILICT